MWIQNNRIRAAFLLFSVFALTLWLTACGGSGGTGGSGSMSGANGTGTVAVVITDAPGSEFDEINVTVTRIELLSDAGQVTIFEGEKTFNLLQLSEVSNFFVVADGVPPGPYDKIRLILSDLELVRKDDQGNVIETFHPMLPGNGKLDLNPRMSFFVVPGETLVAEIDMDAKNSIHIVGTGNDKYQFRPVVFVNILDGSALGKIMRLQGTVAELGDDEFKLCLADSNLQNGDSPFCVEVHSGAGTSIFDAQADPIAFGDLNEGDHVIVYARFRPDGGNPADDAGDDQENDFDVDALVVEVGPAGTFVALTGTADAAPVSDIFPFIIDPAQEGLDAGTTVQVQLQATTPIFSKEGDVLDASAIAVGVMGTASGVLSGGTSLKSTIVILDTSTP
jgi:Domain of unknown function (DUF4382)